MNFSGLFFEESPKPILNRILFIFKLIAYGVGIYALVLAFFNLPALHEVVLGDGEVDYWWPVHWPIKLVFG